MAGIVIAIYLKVKIFHLFVSTDEVSVVDRM